MKYQVTASDSNGIIEWCPADSKATANRIAATLRRNYPAATVAIGKM